MHIPGDSPEKTEADKVFQAAFQRSKYDIVHPHIPHHALGRYIF